MKLFMALKAYQDKHFWQKICYHHFDQGYSILILNVVPLDPIDNKYVLVQVLAWNLTDARAPSQYKERLSQVWAFPC